MSLIEKVAFIEDVFKGMCRFVGLGKFDVTVDHSGPATYPSKLYVTFRTEIELPMPIDMMHENPQELVHKLMNPIVEAIQESEAVNSALRNMKVEVAAVKEQNGELTIENQELKRFKDHFDVEYKLRHG